MDDTLRLIQHLYGENDDAPVSQWVDDEALQQEYKQLRAVKDALDRRPSRSPDPALVDQVVDHAREAAHDTSASPTDPAPDRSARSPSRRMRRLQGAGTLVAVLLIAGLSWWSLPGDFAPGALLNQPSSSASTASAPAAEQTEDAEAIPDWDDSEDVRRLHRRIEALQTRSRMDTWDASLQPASQSRP